ncbi:MAG: glycoside hydrolase family 127 protein [Candidatus Helarchaeota archaeon]|nr:glycoside hydrolase family 127 protein [Candidatus Helarchaeota archaeon]
MRKHDYLIQPVLFNKVQIRDNFWASRIETNRKVTIPYLFEKCEEHGRIDLFLKAAGMIDDDIEAKMTFEDSDVYKVIEGVAYTLSLKSDPKLEKYVDDIIEKIAAAQEEDGYLFPARAINPEKIPTFAGKNRWELVSDFSHELYNMGHLYESAVAYYQATNKRNFLDIAIKNANLIDEVFEPSRNEDYPGHQEIELGLVRLYRVTENEKYLKLAKFFLDTRGPNGAKYNQAHKKVIDQDEAVGHAVRATYMYSGMTDIAALTNNKDYIKAIDHIWNNVVSKKLYITGGIGAKSADEAFGRNYKLPNLKTYCETCAAIGNIFWNYRMFLLHRDAKYIDILERTLYNGFLSGISFDGKSFFYPNPLASKGKYNRSGWFFVTCCPTNIVRFIPTIPGYVYTQKNKTIFFNLFVSNETTISLDDAENTVKVTQESNYPWEGVVRININPEKSEEFTIAIRIPGWTQNQPVPSDLYTYKNKNDTNVSLKVNNKPRDLIVEKGFARIQRKWKKGDVIELIMPMPIRRVISHEKVKENAGMVALERGPIVYCVESVDNKVEHVFNLLLNDDAELTSEYRKDMLNGIVVITGTIHYIKDPGDKNNIIKNEQDFLAIPYYSWAHRGDGEMTVWMLRDLKAFK